MDLLTKQLEKLEEITKSIKRSKYSLRDVRILKDPRYPTDLIPNIIERISNSTSRFERMVTQIEQSERHFINLYFKLLIYLNFIIRNIRFEPMYGLKIGIGQNMYNDTYAKYILSYLIPLTIIRNILLTGSHDIKEITRELHSFDKIFLHEKTSNDYQINSYNHFQLEKSNQYVYSDDPSILSNPEINHGFNLISYFNNFIKLKIQIDEQKSSKPKPHPDCENINFDSDNSDDKTYFNNTKISFIDEQNSNYKPISLTIQNYKCVGKLNFENKPIQYIIEFCENKFVFAKTNLSNLTNKYFTVSNSSINISNYLDHIKF